MRTLHVIGTIDPASGGPPAVAMALAAAQSIHGSTGVLSATSTETRLAAVEAFASLPGVEGVRHHWVEGPASWLRAMRGGVIDSVASAVADYDILHLHGVWEPLLLHAALASRRAGKPYLVTPHGMLDPWSLAQKRWKKRVALALTHRRMLDGAALLHMLNDEEQRLIEPLRLRPPKRVVSNGVFLQDVDASPGAEPPPPLATALAGRPYVLFLSRLHYKKGLDYLAEAFARVAARGDGETQLVVAGPDGGARGAFEQQVADLGIADRVHLPGPLYGDHKRALLRGAACFCLPSRQEGFSIAITEALAFRLPAVVTDACHFPEVAEVGAGHVVPLGETDTLADALMAVLRDPSLAKQQGEAGRRLVEEQFTWGRVTERFFELYQKLVDGRPL